MAKTLLLADDSVTIQRVIELTFAQEDVRVVSVSDGRRAMEWLETERPDIVLVDVEVPDADGYAVATYVKQSPRLKQVPVLLLAGAFEPVDEARARTIGCEGVLVKPFEPQQLVSRVHALINERAAGAAGRSAEGEPATVTPFPAHGRSPLPSLHAVAPADAAVPQPLEPPSRPVWESGAPGSTSVQPPAAAPAAPPAGPAPRVSLVNAFSALLAAEASTAPAAGTTVPAVSEASVEDAVRRVLVRMTDDLVRRIVVDTAERLIREEIEKIKSSPE
jgi:CheY-like chemotaxis protein